MHSAAVLEFKWVTGVVSKKGAHGKIPDFIHIIPCSLQSLSTILQVVMHVGNQNQEVDFYQDTDSTDVYSKVRSLHKSSNLILIEKDTYPCFLSKAVMYFSYKNDSGDRETDS